MEIGVFGDAHLSRNLPHSKTVNGVDKRYLFQKNLLKEVLEPFDVTIHLGDLTHKKNYIDGKILRDAYNIFKDRKSIHIIGNHDRSADGDKYTSMVEILADTIDDFLVVENIKKLTLDNLKMLFTSYYADDEVIEKNSKGADIVFGHWNFFNPVWGTGKKIKKNNEALYVLGHDHDHHIEDNVMYLGCMNPLRFGEKQGKILVLEQELIDYPRGEEFIMTNKEINVDDPDTTYMKLEVDSLDDSERLKEKYKNLAHFSLKYNIESSADRVNAVKGKVKTHEKYIKEACEELDYDFEVLKDYHNQIKKELQE